MSTFLSLINIFPLFILYSPKKNFKSVLLPDPDLPNIDILFFSPFNSKDIF